MSEVLDVFGSHPVICSACMLITLALLHAIALGNNVVVTRLVAPETLGAIAVQMAYFGSGLQVLTLVAVCVALGISAHRAYGVRVVH